MRPTLQTLFDGALVVNKPRGRTSHDVVEGLRRIAGFRQIGHLGTLDPLATGVLVLLMGRATRLTQFYKGRRKRYTCAIRFGFATDTYDAEGTATGEDTRPQLNPEVLARLASEFTGRIAQVPPAYSAKRIHGRRAHELARKKKPVELAAVEVEVFEFRLTGVGGSIARFVIECGSGTYIRSLANDMGQEMGCGAHLAEIVRTAAGEFTLDQSLTMDEIASSAAGGRLGEHVIRMEDLLPDLPRLTLLPILERRVKHGARFNVSLAQIQPGNRDLTQGATAEFDGGEKTPPRLRVFSQHGQLVAIAEAVVPRTYRPLVVLDTETEN
jgi:tRNA pseudouridine55 synthase